jgi:glutathione S-transferase
MPVALERDINRVKEIWEAHRRENESDGPFLFGKFSIADAMYAPVVCRFRSYNLPVSGYVKKYCETMLSLPAMKEWHQAAVKEPWVIKF